MLKHNGIEVEDRKPLPRWAQWAIVLVLGAFLGAVVIFH